MKQVMMLLTLCVVLTSTVFPFAVINPSNPVTLYAVTTNPANTGGVVFYPRAGMGTGTKYGPNDWTYTTDNDTVYIVPVGTQGFVAADFRVVYDATKATLVNYTTGNLFAGGSFFSGTTGAGQVVIHTANLSPTINVAPAAGQYLARLVFTISKPGNAVLSVDNYNFQYYDALNDVRDSVLVNGVVKNVKFYLGDFANAVDDLSGDGLVDFNDLVPFSIAYWSQSSGTPAGYRAKFDIGPTNASGSYFAMPTPDGKIEFEDLVIFAIGYGKSAAGQLPKQSVKPITLALDQAVRTGDAVRVPIAVSGPVADLRAISMTLKAEGLTFQGVEKAGAMNNDYCFMTSKANGGSVTIDAAVLGGERTGLSKAGVIAYATFTGTGSVSLEQARARTSSNTAIQVNLGSALQGRALPASYQLEQNYPNPFNPSTTIHYALPNDGHVKVVVYNLLGEAVATLVDADQAAGSYEIRWDGTNNSHQALSSGMYLYKIQAGDFSAVRKMLFAK